METHALTGWEERLCSWFVEFERWHSEDEQRPQDQREGELVAYHEQVGHGTDSKESVAFRHEVLARSRLLKCPELPRLDNQRQFSDEQRLAIYRKSDGRCQWRNPDGSLHDLKCPWNDWHADHIMPWSRGGKTTVENGQVLCAELNRLKGADLPTE